MSESPFLPGTKIQYAWDSTSLGMFKTCPRLYYYTMIQGWSTKEDSVHLRYGIEFHTAMQGYDLSRAAGIKHDDAVHDVLRDLMLRTADFDSDHKTKTRASLIRSVIWYLDNYKDDPGETLILKNGKPAVELSFRFDLGWGPDAEHKYMLCGHLDKVSSLAGELYAKDYKTVWSFWNQFWEPDNQMTLYTLASKVVLDAPVKGVVIDMIQLKTKEGEVYPEFSRAITHRTPDQLEEWVGDLRDWLSLAERYAIEDRWPMNDTSCGKYGGCRFRDICSKSPQVRERFLESNFIQLPEDARWNPLRAR